MVEATGGAIFAGSGGMTGATEAAATARRGGTVGDWHLHQFHAVICRRPGSSGSGIQTARQDISPHHSAGRAA